MNEFAIEILTFLSLISSELLHTPLLGFIPAILFLIFYLIRKSRFTLFTSLSWVVYSFYEYLVQTGVLCSGECNIRFDILLFHPILLLLSILAILIFIFRKKKADKNEFDL